MAMTEAQRAVLPHNLVVLDDMAEADRRGDRETYCELRKKLQVPARTLRALKRAGHVDYIIRAGLDTSLADAEFGPGWMERED